MQREQGRAWLDLATSETAMGGFVQTFHRRELKIQIQGNHDLFMVALNIIRRTVFRCEAQE